MSLYRYIPNPGAVTSSVTGPRTNLVQVPSEYADMAIPAIPAIPAAASPAAAGFGRALLMQVLAEGGVDALQNVFMRATGSANTPQATSGSKFLAPIGDVAASRQRYYDEDYKRAILRMLGFDLPKLNVEELIRSDIDLNRLLAAEAGQRELQRARLAVEQATRPAIAESMGDFAAASAAGLGSIAQNLAYKPDYSAVLAESARALT